MAVLNEEIGKIEIGTNLDTLYNKLLSGFMKAQDDTLPDYTSSEYVSENIGEDGSITYIADEEKIQANVEDQKLITMKNAAYLLASSILGSAGEGGGGSGGEGSSGGLFVSKSGDYMTGKLSTLFGFDAGDNGVKILEVYRTKEDVASDRTSIVKIRGQLHLEPYGLFINGSNVMNYNNDILTFKSTNISIDGHVTCSNDISVGDVFIGQNGVFLNYDGGQYIYYHSGISNREDINWTMKNGTVAGDLYVKGASTFNGSIIALNGCSFGAEGSRVLTIVDKSAVNISGDIKMSGSLILRGDKVLYFKNSSILSISAPDKSINLGDDNTMQINLQSGIYDDDGEYQLVSKFGDGYFPNSFRAGHSLGNVLLETYKTSTDDSGVVVGRVLRFNNVAGPSFNSNGDNLKFTSTFKYNVNDNGETSQVTEYRESLIQFKESTSLYAPLNRKSASLVFETDADFYVFDKPIESKKSIGIAESKTRLSDKQLFFDDSVYWQAIVDGVKHYGNAYMVNSIGSVEFSSGFAGSGWKIYKNLLTGSISATFDELTIRKKMRVYELEVQKQSVTNGSLWVSDACSGDIVEEII